MKVHGVCHCGEVSYEAEVEPGSVVLCHCADCQQFAGSAFRAMIGAKGETVHFTGTPNIYVKTADSGRPRHQGFCGACGSHLFATDPERTHYGLRLGAIAERHQLGAPARQLWTASAMDWAFDLDGVPKLAGQS